MIIQITFFTIVVILGFAQLRHLLKEILKELKEINQRQARILETGCKHSEHK